MIRRLGMLVALLGVLSACEGEPDAPLIEDDQPAEAHEKKAVDVDLPEADSEPTPAPETDAGPPPVVMHMPLLKAGIHPDASDAMRKAGVTAAIVLQTIGDAASSAGTHAQDGTIDGKPYSAATDIAAKSLTNAQIQKMLDDLGRYGFAAWYRKTGQDGWYTQETPHIHAVWAGCKMKLSLRNQLRDFFVGKNGLVSHTTYTFFTWPAPSIDYVRTQFLEYNPATN
jgi:hypothetical protein